jgi:hypothetical protein
VSALAFVVLSAPAAQASLGIDKFVGINCNATAETCGESNKGPLSETVEPEIVKSEAEGDTQAAGHVPFGVTDFTVTHTGEIKTDTAVPDAVVTHVRVDVAPGLATSPANVPQCTMNEFGEGPPNAAKFGFYEAPKCKAGGPEYHETGPESTIIGEEKAIVYVNGLGDLPLSGVLYNLVPPAPPAKPRASLFGAALKLPKFLTELILKKYGVPSPESEGQYYAHTLVEGNVEWGKEAKGTGAGDYHDYFEVNVSPALPLIRSRQLDYGRAGNGAFITNATNCPGNHTTTLSLEGVPLGTEEEIAKSVASGQREFSRKPYETLIGLQNCKAVPFNPLFSLETGGSESDKPDQLTTAVSLEHFTEAEEVDSSQVKTATVTLPEGMTLNPSAAYGLEACTVAQARIHSETFGVACPAGSELGTVSLEVPTLPPGSLTGTMYLGGPVTGSETGPITGPPYIVYIVANSARYGVSVRLKAEVEPNLATGQVKTVLNENPEQPFSKLTLHFNRGVLTSVANPLLCGTATGSTSFAPVATEGVKTATAGFGVPITGCVSSSPPFAPTQSTSVLPATGGSDTDFKFTLTRPEGQQYVEKISTTLPPGVVGKIPTVTQCTEAQANATQESGGGCPASSQIGTVRVTTGSGEPYPFTGTVYLTGPYQGAPYGLAFKVPVVAGPFKFTEEVTRATINVNQRTSRVTVAAKLPTIKDGIPLRLRSMTVDVSRPNYILDPTNCGAFKTESAVTSTLNTTALATSPFQVEGCSGLAFKPTFAASTSGKASKASGASLVTTITQAPGQANIASVFVQLPKQLPSRLSTLNKACLLKTFEENPYLCSKESMVGTATAVTPVLPNVMKGPAIFVSRAGEEFPSLELVLEADGVRVIVEGKTHIKKGITTTNFATTPDVPVSSITVSLPLGPFSALAPERTENPHKTNLCTEKLVMPTTITGQNGVVVQKQTIISPSECGVQILKQKVKGNTAYVTVETYAAGRVSISGNGLSTTRKTFTAAKKTVTIKVPLSRSARRRRRPFKIEVRVGFVPKQRGAKVSSASQSVKV